ncbi:protein O-mannosyl-transferase Tmtc3-like [Scylla paramamosain]|uniref:protein O-mannosyl-transferase Tmtc3-like n=1 Tax=Scylla paramamosain TaxID=85552 RepID=UPI003083E418
MAHHMGILAFMSVSLISLTSASFTVARCLVSFPSVPHSSARVTVCVFPAGGSVCGWVYSSLVLTVALLVYCNALSCSFVFDDISAIKENRDLRPHTPVTNLFFHDFWGTPMQKEQSHKSYRPLCVLTFRLNYLLHGLEPLGYHLVNMLLHGVVCILYYRMCSMFLPELSSFVASLLFAVHPIHTEAVTGVVGRAETLSSLFFLGSLVAYSGATAKQVRGARGARVATDWRLLLLAMLLATTAMLCKEQGITVIAICAVYELFIVQKVRGWELVQFGEGVVSGKGSVPPWLADMAPRVFVLVATTLGLMLARVHVMGAQLPVFTRFDNPASVAPSPSRQLTYNYLLSVNAGLLLLPSTLCCDWTMGTIPLVESFTDVRNLGTVALYLTLAKLSYHALFVAHRHHAQVIIMSLAFVVLPFLPATNLFFPVGFVVAERVLYMPSMGFCMLVAHGFTNLLDRVQAKKYLWLALLGLLAVHAVKTHVRNFDWRDEYTIFTAGLKVNQRNAKLFNNVGHALESQGRFAEALRYFQAAVSVQEDDIGAHINVGRTYNNLKLFSDAEQAYLKAKSLLPKAKPGESYQARIAPNHLNVFLNLANLIARNETRLEEADALYRQAISMRADYTQAYINRGDILIKMNRTKEAQEVYERALFYDSTNPDIYYNLGVVLLEQGRAQQALAYLDKALEMDPDHQQALLNSAVLIQESGNAELRPLAYQRLLRLVQRDPLNERIYFNLGMIAMDDRDYRNAEKWFRKAIELKEDFRSALFNLALLLTDDQRPLEAAPFLNQLVKHHPDHVKGLILLGDIYINNIKDLDAAEKCYERILAVDPGNVQGLHNLCVVYVERGELQAAESCLSRAHVMAPHEDYILRHLKIVRTRLAKFSQMQQQQQQQQQQGGGGSDRTPASVLPEGADASEGISESNPSRPKKTVFITKNSDSNSKTSEKQLTRMVGATVNSDTSDSLS